MAPTVNIGDSVHYVVTGNPLDASETKCLKATVKDVPAYLDRSNDQGAMVRNDGSVVSLTVFHDEGDHDKNYTANRSEPLYVPYSSEKGLGTWHLPESEEE